MRISVEKVTAYADGILCGKECLNCSSLHEAGKDSIYHTGENKKTKPLTFNSAYS